MPALDPGRPTAGEHIPYYAQYIDLVPDGDIIAILERQIHDTATYFSGLTPAQMRWRPAPGEWNAIEIVGHVADVERVFSYRALRIARADSTAWASVEFDPYVSEARFAERPMKSVIDELLTVRNATVALLRGLPEAAWTHRMPEECTMRSVRAIAYILAGHELHHVADLRASPLPAG